MKKFKKSEKRRRKELKTISIVESELSKFLKD